MYRWHRVLASTVLIVVALGAALLGFVYTLPVIGAVVIRRKGPPPVLIVEARPVAVGYEPGRCDTNSDSRTAYGLSLQTQDGLGPLR